MPYFPPEASPNLDKFNEYELHMDKLLSAHLLEFDLPVRIVFALADNGINRLRDLVATNPRELAKIPNIGATAIRTITNFLHYNKLDYGMKKG